jgi:hypothetical protein
MKLKYSKKTISKKKKGGGIFRRSIALIKGKKVKTFCCKSKKHRYVTGIPISVGRDKLKMLNTGSGTNTGSNCEPSDSGQCDAGYGESKHNYKFRCFDTKEEGNRAEIDETTWFNDGISRTMDDSELHENCQYVAGILGKVGSTLLNPNPFAHVPGNNNSEIGINFNGGKKYLKSKRKPQRFLTKKNK